MESDVLEVKQLIEKLRVADSALRVFGAKSHRYHIGPPLSETEVHAFEKTHGISLPQDYRLYLQLVGDGSGRPPQPHPFNAPWSAAGAGPGYGLYQLVKTVNGDSVGRPFPFEEELQLSDEPPYDTWDDNIPGALEIGTEGCTSHTHLIVKGPTFGMVWEGYDYDHFTPTNLTFIQWMRGWAERALRILANEPLVEKLAVGMTKQQVVAAVGGDWKERKNLYAAEFYFEASEIPAQLILSGDNGVVTNIKRWLFI